MMEQMKYEVALDDWVFHSGTLSAAFSLYDSFWQNWSDWKHFVPVKVLDDI